ncbi:breast carcinoma-amplified sequence 1 isoform 2-T2 [Dugong dugon]
MGNQMSVPQSVDVEDQEDKSETVTNQAPSGKECAINGAPAILSTYTIQHYEKVSQPVPGRAGDQAADSSIGSVQLDVRSNKAPGNKAPSENMALPVAAAAGPSPDKTPGQTPAEAKATSASWGPAPLPTESRGAAPSKPKDTSFFDKLFKLDKGHEKAPVDSQPETQRAKRQEAVEIAGLSRASDDVPAEQDLVDSKEKEEQEITTLSSSVPEAPEELEIAKENPQATVTTENNNSIMSFFKTLGAEKSPPTAADPTSDKANFIPQETQGAAKNPKGSNPPGHVPSAASPEMVKEGTKEKAGPTSLPLGKLFWKKTSDSTEKTTTPPEPEPELATAGQKGREGSSKDKKLPAEMSKQKSNKQEAKEPAPSVEQCVVEVDSLQNGDKPQKRPKKGRQSLGGFLKGLGPKQMLDAEVQTDPVSIGPIGKSK